MGAVFLAALIDPRGGARLATRPTGPGGRRARVLRSCSSTGRGTTDRRRRRAGAGHPLLLRPCAFRALSPALIVAKGSECPRQHSDRMARLLDRPHLWRRRGRVDRGSWAWPSIQPSSPSATSSGQSLSSYFLCTSGIALLVWARSSGSPPGPMLWRASSWAWRLSRRSRAVLFPPLAAVLSSPIRDRHQPRRAALRALSLRGRLCGRRSCPGRCTSTSPASPWWW